MAEIVETQREKDIAYWRGRVDGHLESLNARFEILETHMEAHHSENVLRLDHMHACIERRSKVLYLLTGGLVTLYILFQVVGPIILRLITKP